MDIGASAKLELVDKSCCLGDMLSVDGDADSAVEARIRIGWNKFRQLACKERKCGGTSASRDENGQVDVWR